MKKLLPLFILIFALGISAQVRKPVKPTPKPTLVAEIKPVQKVVIEKINGDKLTGLFVGANTDTLTIQISETNLPVKFSEIKAVWFGDMPEKPVADTQKTKEQENFQEALKLLRKLASATGTGINYTEYNTRVIDTNAEVSEFLINIPDGYIKDEIRASLQAFTDARDAWSWSITNRSGDMFPDYEPGKSLQKKYNVQTYRGGSLNLMEVSKVVDAAWAAAKTHLENAQNGKP
jgi:hypothetical protein